MSENKKDRPENNEKAAVSRTERKPDNNNNNNNNNRKNSRPARPAGPRQNPAMRAAALKQSAASRSGNGPKQNPNMKAAAEASRQRQEQEKKAESDRKAEPVRKPEPAKKKEKKSTDRKLYAPANGKLIPLSSVADPVLANKMLGEGIAVDISGSQIVAPCSGTVVMISNYCHAIGIESDLGDSVLVHIGMDTANYKGKGFEVLVSDSQKVKPGQPLVRLDRKFFEQQNADLTTCVIVTNADWGDYQILEGETAAAGRTPVMEKTV